MARESTLYECIEDCTAANTWANEIHFDVLRVGHAVNEMTVKEWNDEMNYLANTYAPAYVGLIYTGSLMQAAKQRMFCTWNTIGYGHDAMNGYTWFAGKHLFNNEVGALDYCYFGYYGIQYFYEVAHKSGYGRLSKWNSELAWQEWKAIIDAKGYGVYAGNPITLASLSSNRTYDENLLCVNVFLDMYLIDKVANAGALTEAMALWTYINANQWNTTNWHYTLADTGYETGGSFIPFVVAKLRAVNGYTLDNWGRVEIDITNRFLTSGWASPQWTFGGTKYYTNIHHATANGQRRMNDGLGSWIMLQTFFHALTSANQTAIQELLDDTDGTTYTADSGNVGGTTTVDAALTEANDYWNGHYIEYLTGSNAGERREITDFDAATDTLTHDAFSNQVIAGDTFKLSHRGWEFMMDHSTCYDDGTKKWKLHSDDGAVSEKGTAISILCLWLMGIVPDTGSLAIPVTHDWYMDATLSGYCRFDINTRIIQIPVYAGDISFIYCQSHGGVSHTFGSDGVYELEFSDDWEQIGRVTKICELDPSLFWVTQPSTDYIISYARDANNNVASPFDGIFRTDGETATYNALTLDSLVDDETGWFNENFSDDRDADMIIVPKGEHNASLGVGYYVQHDAVSFTLADINAGDKVTDEAGNNTYRVDSTRDIFKGKVLWARELQLKLEEYGVAP